MGAFLRLIQQLDSPTKASTSTQQHTHDSPKAYFSKSTPNVYHWLLLLLV